MGKRNYLNGSKAFQLTRWLDENWEIFEKQPVSYAEAATMAQKALGFRVEPANIAGACRNLEKTWPGGRGRKNGGSKEIADLQAAVRVLTKAVDELYGQLGMEKGMELRVLCDILK